MSADAPAAYHFDHSFAEPFTALEATVGLAALDATDSGKEAIFSLAALMGIATLFGLVAVHRSVATVVEFARRRSDFVAAVSHELKTPLTSIRMYAEMLRDGMVPEDRRREYYDTITAEGERLSRLIENVLELSRLERDDRPVRLEAGNLADVVDELVRILSPHAERLGLTLEVEVDSDLPSVRYDHDALMQVLVNLVDNAIKFSKSADIPRVVVQCTTEDGHVVLRVRDHGPGVPRKQLDRIFKPFYRGQRELTRTTKGTGIGLALVQGLVVRMGGHVSARNHPDGGLEVAVALPVVS
jgi:signal transduction histidine kinase